MWHETIAQRGANEIGSCLLRFIEEMVNCGKKSFVFYSDNCAGQNKNRYLFNLYRYCLKKFNLQSIIHRFLEKGHTQNEGDSMHALIERCKKNKEVYVPAQWVMLVKMAKRTGEPYKVREMSQEDFFNFKELIKNLNFTTDETNEKVKWTHIREIVVEHEEPDVIQFKYDFAEDHYKKLDLKKISKITRTKKLVTKNEPTKAYHKLIPITKKKYDHLKSLLKHIPREYHEFYQNLPHTNANTGKIECDSEEEI